MNKFFLRLGGLSLLSLAGLLDDLHSKNLSSPFSSLEISLSGGSPDSPSYHVFSPNYTGAIVYRGPVEKVYPQTNDVFLYKSANLSNPSEDAGVFKDGLLASKKARIVVTSLDTNGSITGLEVLNKGAGYRSKPEVHLAHPASVSADFEEAFLSVSWNPSTKEIDNAQTERSGKGYSSSPHLPLVSVEGGPHFVRVSDPESNHTGLSFLVSDNNETALTLENPYGFDLANILPVDSIIEIFEGWTLGSVLGHENTPLTSNENPQLADWVYLMKDPLEQDGTPDDFVPYFHDGQSWKEVFSPSTDSSNLIIFPDSSLMIARRSALSILLKNNGRVSYSDTYISLPESGKRRLFNNPFPGGVMLSDLFHGNISLTQDNESANHSKQWLVHPNQEIADNLLILTNSSWQTYWHDGTNYSVSQKAEVSVRAGSGIGAALTSRDFSMSQGAISAVTNAYQSPVLITSEDHGLRDGFMAKISGLYGYKTNQNKDQIDEDGNIVSDGNGLVIESSLNQKWKVQVVDEDSFILLGSQGDCDFDSSISPANWYTGSKGAGYTSDASVTITGGGGTGARAIARVGPDGSISSIRILSGGFGYTGIPTAQIHAGGWRNLTSGNVPYSNVFIPPCSGLLMERNHPFGVATQIKVSSPFNGH